MLDYMKFGNKKWRKIAIVDTSTHTFDYALISLAASVSFLYIGTMKQAIGVSHNASIFILVLGIGLILLSIYFFWHVNVVLLDLNKRELVTGGIFSFFINSEKYCFDRVKFVKAGWAFGQKCCYEATVDLLRSKKPVCIARSNSLGCINKLVLEVAEFLNVDAMVYRRRGRRHDATDEEPTYGGLMFDLHLPNFLLGKNVGITDYFILGKNSDSDLKVVSVGYQKFSVIVISILFSLFCFFANILDKEEGIRMSVANAWFSAGIFSLAFAILLILTLKVVHFDKKKQLVKFRHLISPIPWMKYRFSQIAYISTDSLIIENLESERTKSLYEARIHVPGREPMPVAYSKSRGSMNALSMVLGKVTGLSAGIKSQG